MPNPDDEPSDPQDPLMVLSRVVRQDAAALDTFPDALTRSITETDLRGRGSRTIVLVLEETGNSLSTLAASYGALYLGLKERNLAELSSYVSHEPESRIYRLSDVLNTSTLGTVGDLDGLRALGLHLKRLMDDLLVTRTRLERATKPAVPEYTFDVGIIALTDDINAIRDRFRHLLVDHLPMAQGHADHIYLVLGGEPPDRRSRWGRRR